MPTARVEDLQIGPMGWRSLCSNIFATNFFIPTIFHMFWIAPTLVFHFQQDDRPIILDAIAHVETSTFSFQKTLRDI
jgi:hypothetical protein